MNKNLIITSFLGAFTIILGAFGAHALKDKLDLQSLGSYETAVRYMMYHVIVLLFVNTYSPLSDKSKNITSYLFFIGILFFSGSIFSIILLDIPAKNIWFITPIGGIFLIFGWLKLAISFLQKKN